MRENDIVDGLIELSSELLLKTDNLEPGLKKDLEKRVQIMLITDESLSLERAVPSYIKYVLKNGSNFEKLDL